MASREETTAIHHRWRTWLSLLTLAALSWPLSALGLEDTLGGKRLSLRVGTDQAKLRLLLRDAQLATPIPNPTTGFSLRIEGGAALAGCTVQIAFEPSAWRPIGADGANLGYLYRNVSAAGTWRAVLRPGRLLIVGRGFPCALAAPQDEPLRVRLLRGSDLLCAEFGGVVRANRSDRYLAVDAPPPATCPAPQKHDVTVANLNILHGNACPSDTGNCRLSDRVDLLYEWIASRGCPDVVALQEVSAAAVPLLRAHLSSVCPFTYNEAYTAWNGADDQMILSRFPVTQKAVQMLYGFFRTVSHARIDHPLGPIDVFSTHLVSGADGVFGDGNDPCGLGPFPCPPECAALGSMSKRECQTVEMMAFVAARHDVATPAIVAGDMNDPPTGASYARMTAAGWIDSHLAAGNSECTAVSADGCTGVRSASPASLESASPGDGRSRVDYSFVVPPSAPSSCVTSLDGPDDADADGIGTGLFAAVANPFAASCGPTPEPICWVSDHNGTELDLHCD